MKNVHQAFSGKLLHTAIEATFERRGTDWPTETPVALTRAFHGLPDKQTQWSAFLRKSKLEPHDFAQTIQQISRFLVPVLLENVHHKHWHPAEGWRDSPS